MEGLNLLGVWHRDQVATRFDWYELEYGRKLHARGGELAFDWLGAAGLTAADVTAGRNATAQFKLTGFGDGRPRIFDIKRPRDLEEIVDSLPIHILFLPAPEQHMEAPSALQLAGAGGAVAGHLGRHPIEHLVHYEGGSAGCESEEGRQARDPVADLLSPSART